VVEGSVISDLYDPMIAKLIVRDQDRESARRRMLRALSEFEVAGVKSLIPIHQAILEHPDFIAGRTMHEFVEGGGYQATLPQEPDEPSQNGRVSADNELRTVVAEVDGKRFEVAVTVPEHPGRTRLRARRAALAEREGGQHGAHDVVRSPMQGTVLKVNVAAGDEIAAGQVLVVVEAMKMENEIVAHEAGVVETVAVAAGDQVASGAKLLRLA
jgi:acetyl-CoA/propionyl-CoA carboxylase biotin carboxyl carrier protein